MQIRKLGLESSKELYPSLDDCYLTKIKSYFEESKAAPPNAKSLQEIIIFYFLFYMRRRGRKNLRPMLKNTFKVATDPENNRSIFTKPSTNVTKITLTVKLQLQMTDTSMMFQASKILN